MVSRNDIIIMAFSAKVTNYLNKIWLDTFSHFAMALFPDPLIYIYAYKGMSILYYFLMLSLT